MRHFLSTQFRWGALRGCGFWLLAAMGWMMPNAMTSITASEPETASKVVDEELVDVGSKSNRRGQERRGHRRFTELLKQSAARAPVQVIVSDSQVAGFESLLLETLRATINDGAIENALGNGDALPGELVSKWEATGWAIEAIRLSAKDVCLVLFELEGAQTGRGFYAIRCGTSSRLGIQVPHRFFDLYTGDIARKLFLEQELAVACWNSVHRRHMDLAHAERHYFNAFTRAIVQFRTDMVLLQLHGFAEQEEQIEHPGAKTAIVSDGTRFPGRLVHLLALELKALLGGEEVALFPLESSLLGGTQNAQAAVMRASGSIGFLHLELEKNYRKQLKKSQSARGSFFTTLAKAIATEGN